MKYITGTLDFKLNKRSAITLGKFDGLHRGHMKLINRVLSLNSGGMETVVFAFDMSCQEAEDDNDFRTLLTNEERKNVVAATGIDCLVECPFVSEIMNMEPEIFVKEMLVNQLKASHVVVGTDFHFGHKRKGDPQMLVKLGRQYGFTVEVLEKVFDGDREISSTYIREEVEKGNIEKANELLGYPYFITGEVVRGRHIGSSIGMPTINQSLPATKQLPPFGVYTSRTKVGGKKYRSITNIGVKPTVGSDEVVVETNLFDCHEDLYGFMAKVELYHFQRPEAKFATLEELKNQIEKDVQKAKSWNGN